MSQLLSCEISYTLVGDYYIPNIALPEENRPIGKWGRLHRDYLEQHHPIRFNDLVLSGQLWTYLADLNEQAQERLSLIIEQMKASEGVTEELKATNQMAWIGAMNSRNEEKLQATMTDAQKELFTKYTDCVRELQAMEERLLFRNSFKLGARIMLEVMEE